MIQRLIAILLFSFWFGSCSNQLQPSRERLEKVSKVKLPSTFVVIKDEYQDMGQDYSIYYDLKFDSQSTTRLVEGIKNSGLYNSNSTFRIFTDSSYNSKPNDHFVWYNINKGYEFRGKDGDVLYLITLDTTANILQYHEYVL